MSTSTSSASGSTVTVADDVWMRPWLSVTGTRCTRCGPPSCFMRLHTPSPFTRNVTSLYPPMSDASAPSTSSFHPTRAGVALIHAEQITREQVRLLPALGAPDLDDDVLLVVRILRQEQHPQLLLQTLEIGLGLGHFEPHRLTIVARRLGKHLLRGFEILGAAAVRAVARYDRAEILVPLRGAPELRGIGEHRRVAQLCFDGGELVLESS